MPAAPPAPGLPGLYRDTRQRLAALVSGLDDAALATAVPACPGWSVREVITHLAAVTEDALAGRLTGLPSEAETASQLARFGDLDLPGILAMWDRNAPQFEEVIGAFGVWPAVIDVASHEQDIRGALAHPGARDSEVIRACAGQLLARLKPVLPMRVLVADSEFRVGPAGGVPLALTTTWFEAFRWRMGRRSRAQLAALAWSGDPSPVLDQLVVFGPAASDIIE